MKKLFAILMAAIMALSMVSFASADGNEYAITIWAPEEAVPLTKAQVEAFNASNELGVKFNVTVEPVSEANSATSMIQDVEAGADIFFFAQDQFARLVQAGALAKIDDETAAKIKAENDVSAVTASTSGDALYAYPLTADNGYYMYYDKSVIPEEDVDSLEKLIADCEAAQKYFAFEMQTSAWYLASFFFATGCVSEWKTDDEGEFIEVRDTFDSPEGLIAAKGINKLVKSPIHLSSSQASEFASNAAIVVSGIWGYTTAKDILGDNMGVTDLPSFEVDGKEYHLGSFSGCKLLGVKPQVDHGKATALTALAIYLTGEQCQLERFEDRAWGPSNLAAQGSEAVQANPGLLALQKQNQFATVQGQIHGSWWDIAKVIGDDIKAAEDDAGLQAALDNYLDKISGLFNLADDVKYGWTVIGTCNLEEGFFYTDYSDGRSTWTDDIPMVKGEDGLWKTDKAYEMEAGVEFKVRQGLSWDNAFPADNFKVEEAGTYFVQFDEESGEVSLVAE
ncbi:MAG: extracellular solute-binding protein [Clostridia bacterium]|nr:extracellular solute-binding protein [Clostridia bacterium]